MKRPLFITRWLPVAVVSICAVGTAFAQSSTSGAVESGTYRLYKFEQAIGEERYTLSRERGSVVLTDTFLFTDRGTDVPLETTFRAAADLTPLSFDSRGKSSRTSNVDVAVRVQNRTAAVRQLQQSTEMHPPARFFVINGYSPVAQQMVMLRYWLGHGSPPRLSVVPQGSVHIRRRGVERVSVNGAAVTLTRYSISGLIWGQEVLWLDAGRKLVALVGNDAEFDHFEATAEGYESMLPDFVAKAAQDGMEALAELSERLRVTQQGRLADRKSVV